MIEKIIRGTDEKVKELGGQLRSSFTEGLLLADDPTLHRHIKQRIRQKLKTESKLPAPSLIDDILPPKLTTFLAEEVELQDIDLPIASEKLQESVFKKILNNLAHLDFRSFTNAQQAHFSVYDPEVITPQVSWAIEQIFHNLPGFFNSLSELSPDDQLLRDKQTDIIRNIFILGYAHGFLSDASPDLVSTTTFLADSIKKSSTTEKKLKPYPAFLRKLLETDESARVSSRLDQLKKHWHQQLVRRWLLLSKIDETSAEALSQSTRDQVERTLPIDRRPAENLAVARKMDMLGKMRQLLQGENPRPDGQPTQGSNERTQIREELQLTMEIAQQQQSTITHVRDILRLYQGNNQEVFHNGRQTTEKWLPYQMAAEAILQQLVVGFTALNEAKDDEGKFDSVMETIIKSMLQLLTVPGKNSALVVREMFGSDFFSLARIEQLCLLAFTAFSFVGRETNTTKLAIQVLDRLVVSRLEKQFDLDEANKKSLTANAGAFNLAAFDPQLFADKSQQAKVALNTLQPADELVSVESAAFQQLQQEKKQQLAGVSKLYAFFASLTSENWGDHARLKPIFLKIIFVLSALGSGYLNFNLSHALLTESLENLYSADPYLFLLLILPSLSITLASGVSLLGDNARRGFKKLSPSSSELTKELKKFSNGGLRQIASMVLFLVIYGASSTFPVWEKPAKDVLTYLQDRWEETFNPDEKNPAEQDPAEIAKTFWENRNPEADDPKELLNIKKIDWGEVVIGKEVYGQTNISPIGFINTFIVSPSISDSGNVEYKTKTSSVDYDRTDWMIINATDYSTSPDQIVFTLSNGESFIQPAAGTDFVIKNGLKNGENGFAKFLDTGRYIDKIIIVTPPSEKNNFSTFFNKDETFLYFDRIDQLAAALQSEQEYFVVYKTTPEATNKMEPRSVKLDENLAFWQTFSKERQIIQEVLEKENPAAAAMYSQMREEQQEFWANYNPQPDSVANYLEMVNRQVDDYQHFVQTNHVYSSKYTPSTNYATEYPQIGVVLDVMAFKNGGYYCVTAHLAAQEWFISLGVPTEGLYGNHIFDDGGMARSRVGHVKTGIFDAVYDFTPTTPNPDENLSALDFDKNTAVAGKLDSNTVAEKPAAIDLLQNLATTDNLALLILLLSTAGVGFSTKLGIDQLKEKFSKPKGNKLDQIKQLLPENELAMRSLAAGLVQLFQLLSEVDDLFPADELNSNNRSQGLAQIVKESLILASTPLITQRELINSGSMDPRVLSLIQLVGISEGSVSADALEQAEKLWQKISANKAETTQLLQEVIVLLDKTSDDFKRTYETKKKVINQSVKKLQKQLVRIKRKETRMYGTYGTFLEASHLMGSQKLNEERSAITANYVTINHELEKRTAELQRLTLQVKLLPINANNLKKVVNFILTDIKRGTQPHE